MTNEQKQRLAAINYARPVIADAVGDATVEELTPLIGARIMAVNCQEYSLTLKLDNGLELKVTGGRWEGCCLGVDIEPHLEGR